MYHKKRRTEFAVGGSATRGICIICILLNNPVLKLYRSAEQTHYPAGKKRPLIVSTSTERRKDVIAPPQLPCRLVRPRGRTWRWERMEARMQGRTSMVDGQQRKDRTDPTISAAHASPAEDDGDDTMDHLCGSSSSRGRRCTRGDGGGEEPNLRQCERSRA